MMSTPANQANVLYIGGFNRSGSTLLLRLLSAIEGYHSVGELWILDNALRKNPLCGCGVLFSQCEFWVSVMERAFGGPENIDVDHLVALKRSVLGSTNILPLMAPAVRSTDYTNRLYEYSQFLSTLYEAIQFVSGGRVIIDSSKSAAYAFVLAQLPNVSLNVVHLVRDSRAIAYSWQRKKARPEYHWGTEYMEQYSAVRSSVAYCRPNLLLPYVGLTSATYMRMRYEDLARNPRTELERVRVLMGDSRLRFDILSSDNSFALSVDHTVAGNPMRFQRGTLAVSPDDEWKVKLTDRDKYLVTALTWPLLLKYGYLSHGRDTA